MSTGKGDQTILNLCDENGEVKWGKPTQNHNLTGNLEGGDHGNDVQKVTKLQFSRNKKLDITMSHSVSAE